MSAKEPLIKIHAYLLEQRGNHVHAEILYLVENTVYFPLLVLKGIYHYWTYVFQGLRQMDICGVFIECKIRICHKRVTPPKSRFSFWAFL